MSKDTEAQDPADFDSVVHNYIKSPQCIDLPVHGAFGGLNTATGAISMAVFSERGAIPQKITLRPSPIKPGEIEEEREGKSGTVRSVGAVLHFDINTALALRGWLDDKIAQFQEAHPDLMIIAKDEDDGSN